MRHVPPMNILFHQLVPYLGNKRRLLHLILEALEQYRNAASVKMVVRQFLLIFLQVQAWYHVWRVKMVIG